MNPTDYSHDNQGHSGYHHHLTGFGDNPISMMLETYEANGGDDDPTSRAGSSMPPAPHEHENYVPPSDLFTPEEEAEAEENQDNILGDVQNAPWSVDWKGEAKKKLLDALDGYKSHANSIFQAIENFVQEANVIHSEWSKIHQAELAESERLDNLEPNIRRAMTRAEQVHGAHFLAEHDDGSTSP
mmetsp:Transcript_25847/g.48947  ORF Transcript_25847/g.48947 Transcript_25847/m.48947 type:complete len:185 (+) Transcript_25847:90-644(+)|eukprot:scaffold18052_cov175-Amphora_coffeaeformis.AAC.9